MKKIISVFLLLALLTGLTACQTTTPDNTAGSTQPSTEAETQTAIKDITKMTDEDLLRTIATKETFKDHNLKSDYYGGTPAEALMAASVEFKELLNRDTALESLKSHLPALIKEFPDSGIDFLESYLDTIEAYLDPDSATKIANMTDYELLRTIALYEDCTHSMLSSFLPNGSQLSQLMYFSPAFTELVTRSTAVDSINAHVDALMEEFPLCSLSRVKNLIPLIQEYQAQTDCADLSKLDDQELIVAIIDAHSQTNWETWEFFDEHYPLETFMYLCPEFTELMTRPTALDSIKHYMMLEEVSTSALAWLEPYFANIETYLADLK